MSAKSNKEFGRCHLFRGYAKEPAARKAAVRHFAIAADMVITMEIHDGTWAVLGERVARNDSALVLVDVLAQGWVLPLDRMLYGPRGQTVWLSDYNRWRNAVATEAAR